MLKYLPFLFLLLLFSCDKEAETLDSSLQAPVITGYEFRSNTGSPLLHVGKPNIKTEGPEQVWPKTTLHAYPNPVQNFISVNVSSPTAGVKKTIWIVAGRQDNSLESYNFMQAGFPVTGGQPLIKFEVEQGLNQASYQVDLSNLPPGGYRIYAQIGDILLWDNILKTN